MRQKTKGRGLKKQKENILKAGAKQEKTGKNQKKSLFCFCFDACFDVKYDIM